LGVALDPEFETDPYLYVYYTARSEREGQEPGARLSRFPIVDGRAVRESELVILENPGLYDFHQGGSPRFGPDGMLYLGIGDGTCAECARFPDTLLGKIIRIDVRDPVEGQPYRVPEDNPLLDDPDARPEIWALGVRNPWRMAFDSQTDELWVADVGAGYEEEVSIVTKGAHLGWPLYEGFLCRRGSAENCDAVAETTLPIAAYNHSHGCAVIGGVVYRGTAIPFLNGAYLFGDLCSGRIWALVGKGSGDRAVLEIANLDALVVSFGIDADGEVLALGFGGARAATR
jgi:glucose/arabinose dehydrogenase